MPWALTRLVGTLSWLERLSPQAMTLPSERMARLCRRPAAIATTLLRVGGIFRLPPVPLPQVMSVPSARKARLWEPPAATATMLVAEAGTFAWPLLLLPQATTVPSARNARTWEALARLLPAESAITLVAETGI